MSEDLNSEINIHNKMTNASLKGSNEEAIKGFDSLSCLHRKID